MPFDISNSYECFTIENKFKAVLYEALHKKSKKTEWIRLAGLGVGILSAVSTIAMRIGLIVENIIKGFVNIFGAACSKKCSFKNGMVQLFYHALGNMIVLPFSILCAAYGLVEKPLGFLFQPTEYTKERWFDHDPIARKKAAQAAENKLQKYKFDAAMQSINNDPKDTASIKYVATCYKSGQGVTKDLKEALKYYERAANLWDVDSMSWLGHAYLGTNGLPLDNDQAFQWSKKAAILGNSNSMFLVGAFYNIGQGVTQDKSEGIKWWEKAASANHPRALVCMGLKLVEGVDISKDENKAAVYFRRAIKAGDKDAKKYLNALRMKSSNLGTMKENFDLLLKMSSKDVIEVFP